ncbi:flippase [Methanocaldococcus sp.]
MIKDSIYILLANIYSKFMAYLFYFLTAYLLGTSSFGVLRGILPILDTLTIIFSSGIPPAIAKFLAEDENKDLGNYLGILFFMLFLSLIGFIIALNIKYLLGGHYLYVNNNIYLVVGISVVVSSIIAFSRGILQGLIKIKALASTWFLESTLKILFLIILVLMIGLTGAFLSLTLASLITGVVAFLYILKIMKLNKVNLNINFDILKYSIPIALTSSSYRLFGDMDNIVIMSILGSYMNGIYGYSSLLSRGVYMVSSSISIPLLPKMSKSKDKNLLLKSLILNTLLSLPIILPLFIFPEFFLNLLFHKATEEGAICLRILLISSLLMSYFNIISSSFQALGKAKLSFYIISLGLISNLILNIFLVKAFGIVGGSLATLLASALVLAISYAMMGKL